MAFYKFTYSFQAGFFDFKETWYKDAEGNLDAVLLNAGTYVGPRAQGLGHGVVLYETRVTDVLIPRRTIFRQESGVRAGQPKAGETMRNPIWDAHMFHVSPADGFYRKIWLCRGAPDDYWQINNRGEESVDPVFRKWIEGMGAFLSGSSFCFRSWERFAKKNEIPIQYAVIEEPSRFIKLTATGHGLTIAADVKIQGATGTGYRLLNGPKKVEVLNADELRIRKPVPADLTIVYKGGGTLIPRILAYPRAAKLTYQRYAHRDTGVGPRFMRGAQRRRLTL